MVKTTRRLALALAMLLGPALALRAGDPTVKLSPEVIRMGAFYSGEWMRISGTVAPGSKAIVVLRGPDTEEIFNKKGRIGPIWINSGKVHISGVPSLLLCYSSEPLSKLLRREEIDKHQLDDAAIERQMTVRPREMDLPIIRTHFVRLKTRENVYRMISDGLKMGAADEAGVSYWVDFHWPRKAPPADYEVRVYECRGGVIVGKVGARLEVIKVGFPAAIAALATQHASLYGMLAVLIAVVAGFGIDFLAAGLRKKVRVHPVPPAEPPSPEKASERAGKGAARH
jgi:uncharacterized protein (TIGR02186 family)